jgi:hypothetical protein
MRSIVHARRVRRRGPLLGALLVLLVVAPAHAGTLRLIVAGPGTIGMRPQGQHLDATGVADGGDASQCAQRQMSTGGPPCLFSYAPGTTVTLTASPDPAVGGVTPSFARWGPLECFGAGSCTVVVGNDETVAAATFNPLGVIVATVGDGSVTSEPPGIACDGADPESQCSVDLPAGTPVTLTAHSANTIQWPLGCDTTDGPVCRTAAWSDPWWVFAQFGGAPIDALNRPPRVHVVLRVLKGGSGQGSVAGNKVNCGTGCSAEYEFGERVRLVATPAKGSAFAGWQGACAKDPVCVVPAGAVGSVRALFDRGASSTGPSSPGPTQRPSALTVGAVQVSVAGRRGNRMLSIRLVVDRSARADVRLTRQRRVLARKTSGLRPGGNRMRLRVPRRVSRGRAKVTLRVSSAGTTRTIARSVRLPR